MFKICHKHLAQKHITINGKKSVRPGWLQNCQKKMPNQNKNKNWQQNRRTEKMRIYQPKKTGKQKKCNGKLAKKLAKLQ